MKKIGILTFHYVINEGALLQAYGVLSALKDTFGDTLNYRVEIINYHSIKKEFGNIYLTLHSGIKNRHFFQSILRYINIKKNSYKLFHSSLSKHSLYTDSYKRFLSQFKNTYDLIVVGSDEVWRMDFGSSNIMLLPWPNPYWLGSELKCKKVSFGASANRSNLQRMSSSQELLLQTFLKSFDLISVRDSFSAKFVAEYCKNKKVVKLPDPTFYLDLSETNIANKLSKSGIDLTKPIIIILQNNKHLSKMIREYCDMGGYQLIAIENQNQFAHFNFTYNLSVFEWADIYRYAELCITDRYHGTIFSLKNNIPFLSMDNVKNENGKIYSLLKDLDMLTMYSPKNELNSLDKLEKKIKMIKENWGKANIRDILDMQKKKITDYLDIMRNLIT